MPNNMQTWVLRVQFQSPRRKWKQGRHGSIDLLRNLKNGSVSECQLKTSSKFSTGVRHSVNDELAAGNGSLQVVSPEHSRAAFWRLAKPALIWRKNLLLPLIRIFLHYRAVWCRSSERERISPERVAMRHWDYSDSQFPSGENEAAVKDSMEWMQKKKEREKNK